jgi:hypothetical protein
VLRAGTGDAAGKNLAALGCISAKHVCIFVVDNNFLGAEPADFLSEKAFAFARTIAVILISSRILLISFGTRDLLHLQYLSFHPYKSPVVCDDYADKSFSERNIVGELIDPRRNRCLAV